jgi:hypothetical protein
VADMDQWGATGRFWCSGDLGSGAGSACQLDEG